MKMRICLFVLASGFAVTGCAAGQAQRAAAAAPGAAPPAQTASFVSSPYSCVLSGYVLEDRDAPAPNSSLHLYNVTTHREDDCPIEHDPANDFTHGRYECPATAQGTYTVQLYRNNVPVPNRDRQIASCEPGQPSRIDFAFRADTDVNRRDAGIAQPQRAYACIVSGRITQDGTPIADGADSVICSVGERDPKYESIGDNGNDMSPIVAGRYQCRVSPGQILLTLNNRQTLEDEKRVCATRCEPLPQPADDRTPTRPAEFTCDADFPIAEPPMAVGPPCTLTGTVRKNGAVPPPAEQIKCTPDGALNPINDTTGSYSCGTQQGAVSLTLSSGYGGTKTCTCADTATVCNPSF